MFVATSRDWQYCFVRMKTFILKFHQSFLFFFSIQDSVAGPSSSSIPWSELSTIPELNPPSVMPQGNVGTALSTFVALIRTCKLPSHVIKKLKLEFPKSRSSKRYGAVSFMYKSDKGRKKREKVVECEGNKMKEEDEWKTKSEDTAGQCDISGGEVERHGIATRVKTGEEATGPGSISPNSGIASDVEEDEIPSVSRCRCYIILYK